MSGGAGDALFALRSRLARRTRCSRLAVFSVRTGVSLHTHQSSITRRSWEAFIAGAALGSDRSGRSAASGRSGTAAVASLSLLSGGTSVSVPAGQPLRSRRPVLPFLSLHPLATLGAGRTGQTLRASRSRLALLTGQTGPTRRSFPSSVSVVSLLSSQSGQSRFAGCAGHALFAGRTTLSLPAVATHVSGQTLLAVRSWRARLATGPVWSRRTDQTRPAAWSLMSLLSGVSGLSLLSVLSRRALRSRGTLQTTQTHGSVPAGGARQTRQTMISFGTGWPLVACFSSGSLGAAWTLAAREPCLTLVSLNSLRTCSSPVAFETLQTRKSGQATLSRVPGQTR